jgi:hypothetical protein
MFQYRMKDGWAEIRFDEKPDSEIRRALRDYGFQWDAFYRVWRCEGCPNLAAFAKWLSAEIRGSSVMDDGAVLGGGVASCTF